MKKLLLASSILAFACNSSQQAVTDKTTATMAKDPSPIANTITEEELKNHLYTYASDEFEGRETGKPGQKKAIAYLVSQYKEMGIPPLKEDGDYLQKVPLAVSKLPTGSIVVNQKEFAIGEDFKSIKRINLAWRAKSIEHTLLTRSIFSNGSLNF